MSNANRNFVSIKSASEIKLEGVTVTLDKVNDCLKGVYIADGSGGMCRIVLDSYSLSAQIPAPPKKEKRYVLRGTIDGIGRIDRQFEQQWDADQAKRDIEGKLRGDSDLTVTQEEVEIADAANAAEPDDTIPF